jgi:aminoglycoside 6'-N-acetyltransferase
MPVTLRPVGDADRPALKAIRNEPSVRRWWGEVDDSGEPDADTTELAVDVDGAVAGAVWLWEERSAMYRHAAIDIYLGAAFQGRGIGLDAIRAACWILFEERGHHRITIDPAAANTAAIRCYTKAGFRPIGTLRQSERGPDGTWHDQVLMELLAVDRV